MDILLIFLSVLSVSSLISLFNFESRRIADFVEHYCRREINSKKKSIQIESFWFPTKKQATNKHKKNNCRWNSCVVKFLVEMYNYISMNWSVSFDVYNYIISAVESRLVWIGDAVDTLITIALMTWLQRWLCCHYFYWVK